MKPHDDPWLKNAHANAEHLDREIKKLLALTSPIRENCPVITKYQDFWNQAKQLTTLFRELKPLAQRDRDLLWNQFNDLCRDVKEKQKTEYGALENMSQVHFNEIMQLADFAQVPPGALTGEIHDLVERGQSLKRASDLLGKFRTEMIAKHKKACFDRIQEIRKTHNAAWAPLKNEKPTQQSITRSFVRKNLDANHERRKKAAVALENFQIGRGHILTFLASCRDPMKEASAKAQLAETEARIKDIEEGIRKLDTWIAEDERALGGK
jgi:hypothetical protein